MAYTVNSNSGALNAAIYCANVATKDGLNKLTNPRSVLEYIINFITFGAIRKNYSESYNAFSNAMTTALLSSSANIPPYKVPETLIVDFSGYTVKFNSSQEHSELPEHITIEVRGHGKESSKALVDKDLYSKICTALVLRHKGNLPPTSAVLNDNNGANLRGGVFENFDMSGAYLPYADFSGAKLSNLNMSKADLHDAVFNTNDSCPTSLENINFDESTLDGAFFQQMLLENVSCKGASLQHIHMNNCCFKKIDFSGANCKGADLSGEFPHYRFVMGITSPSFYQPVYINFSDANCEGADLSDNNFSNTNFKDTKLNRAKIENTLLDASDLTNTKLNDIPLSERPLLRLPKWDEESLKRYMNYIEKGNNRNILTTINSISDQYREVKLRMAHELIDSLDSIKNSRTGIYTLAKPIIKNFSNGIYGEDEKISTWLGKYSR
ncbi:MAG: pentapeptide repeat-containing protein [Plesiomonas sp.]|uniref:pentapeptide repeat-containing protein n=1 Tax=Plesiomonas sp. TaxID=2486279 RepID=UPI003F31BA63